MSSSLTLDALPLAHRRLIEQLLAAAGLGPLASAADAGGGRGVFSVVYRITVERHDGPTLIAKLPIDGPNGEAARLSGAYDREALAYHTLLGRKGAPSHPRCLAHLIDDRGGVALLLEDLGSFRAVDQLAGLEIADAAAVVGQLAILHNQNLDDPQLEGYQVRRSAPAAFDPTALERGAESLISRVDSQTQEAFASLLDYRADLVAAFNALPQPTLCHGDPRADNVVFDTRGDAVLFDWQQLAIQAGEADLAWLVATSVRVSDRTATEARLLPAYAELTGRSTKETAHRYRLGMLLPGLAVLLLAQRQTSEPRAELMISTSIERIAAAVVAHDVASAA